MKKFKEITDSNGKVISIETSLTGKDLLINRELNKGSAFTQEERIQFKIIGKLPQHVESIVEQAKRCYRMYQEKQTPILKNVFLNNLKQSNATLFYYLAMNHLKEMLPIVYTPTIGDAVEAYSYEFNAPAGLFLAYPDRHKIKDILQAREIDEIDLIIVTDGEGVLGIGDWGVGGMDICTGKLMVYTLCGGVNPRRALPIMLDVGTNNETLLNDPMYLGWRHKRITGKEYDEYIGMVVEGIRETFPDIYLHWEDFGRDNARKNLNRYREKMCTFNDDMQGTGATALASMLSGLNALGEKLKDQRVVFLGAGTAGAGIADQLYRRMLEEGASEQQARANFWLIDRAGLLVEGMDLADFQKPYARSKEEIKNWKLKAANNVGLYDVVKNVKPTILVGCSTVHGAFTEEIVKEMAAHTEHPLIFPLSNPTSKSEAEPKDLLNWTKGKALLATGSPFDPVEFNGKKVRISQCNNAFIFPGLGLGIIACKAKRVTDAMISAAALALSQSSPAIKDKTAPLLPDFDVVHEVSYKIALAVANKAREEGVAGVPDNLDLAKKIDAIFWQPSYLSYKLV